ncbi:MAG: hypothetical protein QG567_2042, partial [Campylobacterota bacterium]|nr:hypothetical protein [Campylobacterota bacterium]
MGIGAYQKIPKEMFPDMAINTIVVKGGYAGSSTTTLEKMAVRDIEESLASVNGIAETSTTIIPGSFSIVIELSDNIDPADTLNKIKDILASTSNNLPSDMRTPTASLSVHSNNLMRIAISSDQKSYEELINIGDEIKNQIAKIDRISEVSITGGSTKEVRITLDQKIIEAYGLNPSQVSSAISSLSYTFPVGEIKEKGNFVFVSTANGKTDEKEWEAAILKIGEKFITLGSIASVNIFYPQETTLSTYNSKPNLTLNISKDPEGDAIAMAKTLRGQIQKIAPKYENVVFDITFDSSKRVKSRLDTVISNLAFGLILVFLTMYYLINLRTALVVTMGVPFAFVIGLLFLYYQGSTMNLVSLLGALIVIGIVVDDAIVVSENIQRHMDEGMEKEKAVTQGTKEMLLPVTLATATTIIAFMPIFSLSAEIGRFFVLIPVVISIVLIGSLIESFLFLPLHAKELYKPHIKSRDWTKANDIYEAILHRVIKYKKTVLFLLIIGIPIGTFYTAKSLNFQFMPRYDSDFVYISGKLDNNTPLEETHKTAQQLEKEIMTLKNEYFIKAASLSTGSRRNLLGEGETGENLFYITLELHEMAEENWINKYINPILTLSFDINNDEKIRTMHSYMIANKVKNLLEPLKKKYSMQELGITSDRPGLLKADIKINLVGQNDEILEDGVKALQGKLESINGIKDVGNNIKYGKEEYKLKVNPYGEKLGLNETIIAQTISKYYLGNRQGVTFGKDSTMDITTHSTLKDNIQSLKD